MLKIVNFTKTIREDAILENINLEFEKGKIYGLLGINGAGKSTLLRSIAGIYYSNSEITLDDISIYENEQCKKSIFYIPDENIFINESTVKNSITSYKKIYKTFDQSIYDELLDIFQLDDTKPIKAMSKGQKKQAILLIALSLNSQYLLLDETFDGVDPLIRIKIKKYLMNLVLEKNICIIMSTHNVSDVENMCDEIILVNNTSATMLLQRDDIYKIQCAFNDEVKFDNTTLNIISISNTQKVYQLVVKGNKDEILDEINNYNPILVDIITPTMEELFILNVEGGI